MTQNVSAEIWEWLQATCSRNAGVRPNLSNYQYMPS